MKQDLKEMRDIMLICLIACGAVFNLHSKFKSDTQSPIKHYIANPDSIQRDSLITNFNTTKQWAHPNLNQKTR